MEEEEDEELRLSRIKELSASLSVLERSSAFKAPDVDLGSTLQRYSRNAPQRGKKSSGPGRKRARSWEKAADERHRDVGTESRGDRFPTPSLKTFLDRDDVIGEITADLELRKRERKAEQDALARSAYASTTERFYDESTRKLQAKKARDLQLSRERQAREEARQQRPMPVLSTLTPQLRKQLERLPKATEFEKIRLAE